MRCLLNVMCLVSLMMFVGCQKKETILDVETPAGGIEIEKSGDGVEIDIKSKDKDGSSIKVDVP